mgnify:CR=1 FL=1
MCKTVANLVKFPNFVDISLKYRWILLEIRTKTLAISALSHHFVYKHVECEKIFKVRAFFWRKNWEFFYCLICNFAKEFLFFVGNIYTHYESSSYNESNKSDYQKSCRRVPHNFFYSICNPNKNSIITLSGILGNICRAYHDSSVSSEIDLMIRPWWVKFSISFESTLMNPISFAQIWMLALGLGLGWSK